MQVQNEKARRFLLNMRHKPATPLSQAFPGVDRQSLAMLQRMLVFDPDGRPSAAQLLSDPYFKGKEPHTKRAYLR